MSFSISMNSSLRLVCFLSIIGLISLSIISILPNSQIEQIRKLGELRAGILPSPAHYIVDNGVIGGFEYDLVNDFAQSINVRVKLVPLKNLEELNQALQQGKIHIGVPGSSASRDNPLQKPGKTYNKSAWHLVYNRNNKKPEKLSGIGKNRLLIAPNSRPALLLNTLKSEYDRLQWIENSAFDTVSLLNLINTHGYFYTLLDSDSFDYFQRIYPRISKAFSVKNTTSNWLFPAKKDPSLYDAANSYLAEIGNHKNCNKHVYFVGDNNLDYSSSLVFLERIETLLPKYRSYFESAALKTAIDWRLLAAISYQESNWDPEAKSFTGVRGLMMLTESTAQRMGIDNRLDPQASIRGGAEYLALIMDSLPERISKPDRFWLALAAYNVGLGHLEDARVLADRSGKDPDKWEEVNQFLPLLSEKQWYEQTKHGRARGNEPVRFVRHIQRYYDILRFYLIRDSYATLDRSDIFLHRLPTANSPVL